MTQLFIASVGLTTAIIKSLQSSQKKRKTIKAREIWSYFWLCAVLDTFDKRIILICFSDLRPPLPQNRPNEYVEHFGSFTAEKKNFPSPLFFAIVLGCILNAHWSLYKWRGTL